MAARVRRAIGGRKPLVKATARDARDGGQTERRPTGSDQPGITSPPEADAIDAAIANQAPLPGRLVGVNFPLLNNPARTVKILDVPLDLTDLECIALMVGVARLGDELRPHREALQKRLVVAQSLPPRG